MKTTIFTVILLSCLLACSKKPMHDPAKTVINEQATAGVFVEENTACICTKEYMPVCGSNGVTYPSSCQAGCAGIKETTEGPCK